MREQSEQGGGNLKERKAVDEPGPSVANAIIPSVSKECILLRTVTKKATLGKNITKNTTNLKSPIKCVAGNFSPHTGHVIGLEKSH